MLGIQIHCAKFIQRLGEKMQFFFLLQFGHICIECSLYYHVQKFPWKWSVLGTSGNQQDLKFPRGGWNGGFECSLPFYFKISVGAPRKAHSHLHCDWCDCLHLISVNIKLNSLKLSSKWVVAELSSSIFEGDMNKNVRLSKWKKSKIIWVGSA